MGQEEQGERYQFGPKSQRHYTNAVLAFRCAASLSPTSFDAHFNAARVTQSLGSDHLPAPDCYNALEEAVAGYRATLPLATNEEEQVDCLFNLAQALVALQEMNDDAARGRRDTAQRLLEAKQLFAEVERLQTAAMEKVFGDSAGADQEEAEIADEGADGRMQTGQATEGRTVTPQLVLDTILEVIEIDLALYSTPSLDVDTLTSLATSAEAALQRAIDLRQQHIPSSSPSVDLSLSLAQINLSSTCSTHLPSLSPLLLDVAAQRDRYETLLQLHPKNPSLLSAYADFLYESLPLQLPPPSNSPSIEARTLKCYETAYKLLSDRFSPLKDVQTHSVPSLLAANLVAQSNLKLLQLLLPTTTTKSPALLEEAQLRAAEAIAITGAGLTVSPSPTDPSSLSINSSPGRRDWRTVKALRDAWFQFIRTQLHLVLQGRGDSEAAVARAKTMLEGWEKVTGRTGQVDALWFVESIKEDPIWVAGAGAEDQAWMELMYM